MSIFSCLRLRASSLPCALLLGACAAGPSRPPQATVALPDSFAAHNDAIENAPAATHWWHLYDDAALDALVADALANNRDLRVAAAHLAEARAALRGRENARLPQTRLNAGAGYGSTMTDQLAAALGNQPVRTGQRFDAGFDLDWEIDLFGRLGRTVQAAGADAEAQRAVEDGVRVEVAARTTQAYLDACGYAFRMATAKRSLELVTRSWQTKTKLRAAGAAPALDVARAAALVEQARAAVPPLAAAHTSALYELAVLTGKPPREVPAAAAACSAIPSLRAPLPIGDVAALLRRRPDVRAAERRLAASTARIGVAVADLYPSVSIGAMGASSASTVAALDRHESTIWRLGPLLSWNFPNFGAARARIAGAHAQEAAALARLDAALLTALKEVEQSLAAYAAAMEKRNALDAAARQSNTTVRLARLGREAGAATALDLLDAERGDVEAQAALAAADAEVATAQVTLFKALGGGWEDAPAVAAAMLVRDADAKR
ncbi:MAG: TolC family protein [Rudaea sp.]|nr:MULTISPECIES: TolC family protein [unclassified Rudaea]MBN8887092.1 TolC family protein [Rudaea sp.]